jgi:hypothetical protein
VIIATEMLSYSQLDERLNSSPEAARALVRRLRLAILDAQTAKEAVARLDSDLKTLRSRPWWRRLAG